MKGGLAQYIEVLERAGELRRVGVRVSADEEIADITERVFRVEGEALLFEETGTDFAVLTNIYGTERRMAMALGAESLEEVAERVEKLVEQITAPKDRLSEKLAMLPLARKASRWMPRNRGGRGACQRVRMRVDLSQLPVLKCHAADGGRFLTLPMVCTTDPTTGARNVGMYRAQILDNQSLALHWHIHKTGARHFEEYRRRGERMPIAVCLGGRPSYAFAAMSPLPDGVDEWLLAGFLDNRSVRLVKCLTNDLRVPEDCDFVIEGYVDPSEELAWEGPFGDHTGFVSAADWYPRMHVTAITHRSDAVYPATVVGIPPQEDFWMARAVERIFLAPMRLALQPELRDVWMPAAGCQHNLALIEIDARYVGNGEKVASSLWGAGQMMFNKYMVIAAGQVRDTERVAARVRGADMVRNLFRSEGVLDVLDHATATPCYGGKCALDLTDVEPRGEFDRPENLRPAGGIESWNEWLAARWGVLVVRAAWGQKVDAKAFITANGLDWLKAIVVMDEATVGMPPERLLWLATANTDPRRDLRLVGLVAVLDARTRPEYPAAVTASPAVTATVSIRWNEYGLGDRISPKLML